MSVGWRREAILVALAAAEASWVTAVAAALTAEGQHPPALLWAGVLTAMLGFFYGYRALLHAGLGPRAVQGAMVVALLAATVLAIRGHVYAGSGARWLAQVVDHLSDLSILVSREMVAAGLMIWLWARAMHLARRSVSVGSVGFSFRAGIVILMWFGLGVGLLGRRDVAPFVVPYFFFALAAVALARIDEVSRLPGGSRAEFSGYWVGWSVAAVGLVAAAGAALAAFFAAGGLDPVGRLLWPLAVGVIALLVGAALLIFGLIQAVLGGLHVDLGGLGQAFQTMMDRLGAMAAGLQSRPEGTAAPEGVLRGLHLGGNLALIAGLILVVMLVTWARLRRAPGPGDTDTHERVRPAGSLAGGLAGLLRAGRDRLAELAGRVGGRSWAAISIRRIYANLARLASEAGYPRAAAQTPDEYLPALYRAFPEGQAEAALITRAYVRAHYGELPDTPEELARIRAAWRRVRDGRPGEPESHLDEE